MLSSPDLTKLAAASSKSEPHTELHLTWLSGHRRDFASIQRVRHVRRGIGKIRPVGKVESFGSDLQLEFLRERKVLHNARVHVDDARSIENTSARISECSGS